MMWSKKHITGLKQHSRDQAPLPSSKKVDSTKLVRNCTGYTSVYDLIHFGSQLKTLLCSNDYHGHDGRFQTVPGINLYHTSLATATLLSTDII